MIDNLIKDSSEKNMLYNAIEEFECIKAKKYGQKNGLIILKIIHWDNV